MVTAVEYLEAFTIRVTFADGFVRDVDLAEHLEGELFEPLKDVEYFRQVAFDLESETVVWPNGADLAPEFLRWGPHRESGCECGYEDSPPPA
ncbi:MAG: DUF2442 domain-containing protein [Anaerolinea sp.]|nr:DUF2442 domain-containing protein [Anaerolinea sp.]